MMKKKQLSRLHQPSLTILCDYVVPYSLKNEVESELKKVEVALGSSKLSPPASGKRNGAQI